MDARPVSRSHTFGRMEYICEVCKGHVTPDRRGKIRVEGVTHTSAPKAWVWGPVPCHDACRTELRTPYDDRVSVEGYRLTWQDMTA
ncbi:hypothetical protein GCM10009733_103300 [Nonomuraea maheshkhaliensis]|uniref:Uncharacterized protein n=1 Tax=Nonomuraea maheshkhaliensis TaxID=419590 RepID=A0ABN2HMU4_9ACTN